MQRILATVSAVLFLSFIACFGSGDNLSESGMGLPRITAEFPETVEAGQTAELLLDVENPGPGDMDTVAIAFALVGPGQGETELPAPLIVIGTNGSSPSIDGVEPSPRGVSQDAVVYTFDGLPEGETRSFTFDVIVPDKPGPAANSVQVYDGRDIERAGGVRVETTVER
jgi:hypothetical protein